MQTNFEIFFVAEWPLLNRKYHRLLSRDTVIYWIWWPPNIPKIDANIMLKSYWKNKTYIDDIYVIPMGRTHQYHSFHTKIFLLNIERTLRKTCSSLYYVRMYPPKRSKFICFTSRSPARVTQGQALSMAICGIQTRDPTGRGCLWLDVKLWLDALDR